MTIKRDPEAPQVKKARRKLVKQLEKEYAQFSPEHVKQVIEQMHGWINRHAAEREVLKDKDIALFDENRHTATISSRYVKQLRDKLKGAFGPLANQTEETEAASQEEATRETPSPDEF